MAGTGFKDSDVSGFCECDACLRCVESWLAGSDSRGVEPLLGHKIDQKPQSPVDLQDTCSNSQVSTPSGFEVTSPSTPNHSAVQRTQSNQPSLGRLQPLIWKSVFTEKHLNHTEAVTLSGSSAGLEATIGLSGVSMEDLQSSSIGASLEFQRTVLSPLLQPRKKTGRKPQSHACYICAVPFPYKKELIKHLVTDHNLQRSTSLLYKRLNAGKKELQRLYDPAK